MWPARPRLSPPPLCAASVSCPCAYRVEPASTLLQRSCLHCKNWLIVDRAAEEWQSALTLLSAKQTIPTKSFLGRGPIDVRASFGPAYFERCLGVDQRSVRRFELTAAI